MLKMKEQISRYEINRNVKLVLVRHGVDLLELQYSCSGKTVGLYGNLKKDSGEEFTPSTIEALSKEILQLPQVVDIYFVLDNWNIHIDIGSLKIHKK